MASQSAFEIDYRPQGNECPFWSFGLSPIGAGGDHNEGRRAEQSHRKFLTLIDPLPLKGDFRHSSIAAISETAESFGLFCVPEIPVFDIQTGFLWLQPRAELTFQNY
jgi:hypothetical protein